ncbi:MAG: hypothetical protein ACE5FU_08905, partial [Nitrospinota bacterium]
MKLRNRVAYLNVLPEEQPKKKLSSLLTVLIYFLILGTILLYLFFYGLAGFFYVSARGHVELSKYFVQTDRSGKIDRYLVRAGEKISWGQPLFVIQRKSTSNFQEIRGVVLENRDGSLSEQLSSFEKTLKNLDREDWRDFSWEESGGVSGNRELAQVVSDIQFVRSNLQSLNKEIKQNRMKKNALAKEFSPECVRELENFGKSVIRGRSGVVRQIEKNDREITRRENSLRASRESLAEWQKVQRALRVGNGTGNGVLVSRELVKINNDIESRQAALLLLRQQFDLKRENRKKLESGFSEARILELRKGPKGGVSGLNGDIEDMRYKVKELENKLDSLVRYRKDLVRNEINSLNYEIKKNIKRIVELRKLSLESGKEDKVIAKELGIVSLDQKYTALLKRQNAFEMKLR